MDQIKTGKFIKTLRREKNMTQEQLAEEMNVSRRTVSRWETGNNMPDLDVLIDMADFFDVDLRELINGEKEGKKMDSELKETLEIAADYADAEKKRKLKKITLIFITGYICLAFVILIERYVQASFAEPKIIEILDFVSGVCVGYSIVAFVCSLAYFRKTVAKK